MKKNNQKTKDWETKKLGEVCTFLRGLTYAKKDQVEKSNNIVLRANNIDRESNTLNLDDLRYISNDIEIPEKKKLKKDSTLICTASGSKSHLGKVAFIEKDSDIAFGGFMGLLVSEKKIISGEYLFKILTSGQFRDHLDSLMSGANINNLKFSLIENFEVSFPKSLDEQKRIVGVLDEVFENIDQAKNIAEKNLKNIQELFESELQNIFSNNGDDWERKNITKIALDIFDGGDKPKENFSKEKTEKYSIPIYSNGEKKDGLFGFTDTARVFDKSITISARGTIGFMKIRKTPFLPIVRLIVVIPNAELISIKFLKYFLDTQVIKKTGTSIPQLTVPMVKEVNISFPKSLTEQQKIIERLDNLKEKVDEGTAILRSKISALDELKKSLLQKAFNGEL